MGRKLPTLALAALDWRLPTGNVPAQECSQQRRPSPTRSCSVGAAGHPHWRPSQWWDSWGPEAIILLGALLVRLPIPSPEWTHIDERAFVLHPLGFWSGDLNPHFFSYPTLQFYVASALYYGYFLLCSDRPLAAFVAYRYFVDPHDLLVLARGLTTVMSVATVAVTMRLGRRVYGRVGGLLAGVILAVLPIHVRFSHLATMDIPAVLWIAWAVLFAVRIVQEGRCLDYALAGVCVGLATATKYPGVAAAVPVAVAGWLRGRSPGNARLCLAGLVAVGVFSAMTPYVWLDFATFRVDLGAMRSAHLQTAASGLEPATHLVQQNLRYGLGLVGLLTMGLSLIWRIRRYRQEEIVLLAALAAVAVLPAVARTEYMRYAAPLAPLAAILILRPLQGLSARRTVQVAWLAAVLIEPTYASIQTWRLLSGPDTRVQARQWLHRQFPEGGRIVRSGERAGRMSLLTPTYVALREVRFVQSYGSDDLLSAFESLGNREDLPPFFVEWDTDSVGPLLGGGEERDGRAVLCRYDHPLRPVYHGETRRRLSAMADPLIGFSPGDAAQAVFDSLDWFFIPLSGCSHLSGAGPTINLASLPLSIVERVPSAQEFFRLRVLLMTADKAAREEKWERASHLHAQVFSQPFIVDELLPKSVSYEFFYGVGMTQYSLGSVRPAIVFWKKAAACNPNRFIVHANLAAALAEVGEKAEARQHLSRALDLCPDHSKAKQALESLGAQL